MPYGTFTRKRTYTRRNKKTGNRFKKTSKTVSRNSARYRNPKVLAVRPSWKNPLPNSGFFKFKYQDSGFLATTNAITYLTDYIFQGNSLFDPDYTGVGVQPYGFDQLCGAGVPFQRYIVYASKIKVYPHFMDEDSVCRAVRWCVYPSISGSGATYREFEDLTSQIFPHKALVMNEVSDQRQNLSCYVSTKNIYRNQTLVETQDGAYYNGNPSNQWFWVVNTNSVLQGASVDLLFDVKITYYCKLAKTNNLNES